MDSKKCTTCGVKKPISEFYKQIASKDGLASECKDCNNIRTKEYNRTISGLITTIYALQRSNSKRRRMDLPSYTKLDLKSWIINQPNFNELYRNWIESDYKTELKPSVDRIDDYKSYSFDNIQLMTWHENNMKGRKDIMIGKNKKYIKAIIQYDEDMNIIKEYHSLRQAERETKIKNSNLSSCCKNKNRKAGGFYWRYKEMK